MQNSLAAYCRRAISTSVPDWSPGKNMFTHKINKRENGMSILIDIAEISTVAEKASWNLANRSVKLGLVWKIERNQPNPNY